MDFDNGKIRKESSLLRHLIILVPIAIAAYLFCGHADIVETSNHSWLLLDSIFKGRFLEFYQLVAEHPMGKTMYYVNGANYNILFYLLFAVFELPVFLAGKIFGFFSEPLVYFTGKAVSAFFFALCILEIGKLAVALGFSKRDKQLAILFFALSPLSIFSSLIMAQYDSIVLFFILIGIRNLLQGKLTACSLWFGVAIVCKSYALMLLVPLVVLVEKRVLHILKLLGISLWLLIPSSFLFLGRTGEVPFTREMILRLIQSRYDGFFPIPLFLLFYAMLCLWAYFHRSSDSEKGKTGMWLCLTVMGLFSLLVNWHPQWLILLVPFAILTTLTTKNRAVWWWLEFIFLLGYFANSLYWFRIEGNIFDFGLLGYAGSKIMTGFFSYVWITDMLKAIPYLDRVIALLLSFPLLGAILFKFPYQGIALGDRMSVQQDKPLREYPLLAVYSHLIFGLLCWAVPTLINWIRWTHI